VGLPITLLWWVLALQAGVDRVVIGKMLDAASVGYYGLGISITGGLALLPMVVGRVLYPRVNREFGRTTDPRTMAGLVLAPTYSLGLLLINCQLLLVAFSPWLYTSLLPRYRPGLMAGQLFVMGSFFVCLLRNGANFLIAIHKERVFLSCTLLALGLNVLMAWLFVKFGWGLSGVALATSLAGMSLSILVWASVLEGLGFHLTRRLISLGCLHLPAVLLGSAFGVLHFFAPSLLHPLNLGLCVATWIVVGLMVNGALYGVSAYRKEMNTWWRHLQSLLRLGRHVPVRGVAEFSKPE